jgi:hypothetical protein
VTTTVTAGRLRECVSAVLSHVRMDDVHVVRIECRGAHPVVDGPFEVDSSLLPFTLDMITTPTGDGDDETVEIEPAG